MSNRRRATKNRVPYGSLRCVFCDKLFKNNSEVFDHELSHDFFSCVHCMKLLKSNPILSYKSLPTSSKSSNRTHTKPRFITDIPCNDSNPNLNNAASSNPRKRKHIDFSFSNPNLHQIPKPIPKKPRISAIDVLNLISDDDDESSLSSDFIADEDTKPKSKPKTNTNNPSKKDSDSDSDIEILASFNDTAKDSTDSDDIDIPSAHNNKSKQEVIILPPPHASIQNANDTNSTTSSSSNDITPEDPSQPCIDWKELDFDSRNPIHCRRSFYRNIDYSVLSQVLHKNLYEQIMHDIHETRANDTEMKLKRFLVEFAVHKIEILMKDRKYFKKRYQSGDIDYSEFVHLYGSLASKIDSAKCDVDIAIEIPPSVQPKLFLRQLANILQKHTIKQGKKFKIERIFSAKVPILKITDPLYNIEADISIYKSHDLCVKYINALLDYNNDERVRQLIIAIKHWSKRRNINCAMSGKINSFGYTILVIKYLQFLCEPVLPVMDYKRIDVSKEQIGNVIESDAYEKQCQDDVLHKYYSRSFEYHSMKLYPAKKKECVNNMSLSELLYGFFEFYGNFDYHQYQISLHTHCLQNKQMYNYVGFTLDQLTLIIQDPIETHNNCGKNVRVPTAELLINEFRRAQLILLYGGDWINDVCCNTMLQPNCFDVLSLNNEIMYYKQHKTNLSQEMSQYIQEYVMDKNMSSDDLLYGYYRNTKKQKKKSKKQKNRNRKRMYHLRRTNSY